MDHATSADPAVQRQLDRLVTLAPGADILGLGRITALLARLGNPHAQLPPVLHVAGTNGKGSTCAFLRAGIEAAGLRVHVYTSPHLVRFNERIRLAGSLIPDDALAPLLEEVLDQGDGIGASFFEVTTATAFLAFARIPADACVVEVGLGGRLDATNVIARPAVTGIAQLGMDHESFLGNRIEDIAAEKAGISKPSAPLFTMAYPESVTARIAEVAGAAGATIYPEGRDWRFALDTDRLRIADADGSFHALTPRLPGRHQAGNAALALVMLRASGLALPHAALHAAPGWADWPARLQHLTQGPLVDRLIPGSELWLDGGHNPAAATAIADFLRARLGLQPVHLILGMLANKGAAGLLGPIAPHLTSLQAVPVPGHDHHPPRTLVDRALDFGVVGAVAADIPDALDAIARRSDPARAPLVLILGSLYLAGTALAANGSLPR